MALHKVLETGFADDNFNMAVQAAIDELEERFGLFLYSDWGCNVKYITTADDRTSRTLFHLISAKDEKSKPNPYVEAQINSMEKYHMDATYRMYIYAVLERLVEIGLEESDFYTRIEHESFIDERERVNELSPDIIEWLLDTKNGPGIAIDYGGIKLEAEYSERNPKATSEDDLWLPAKEIDTILIGFSGARKGTWNTFMSIYLLGKIIKYLETIPDERFTFNFEPFAGENRNPGMDSISFWLKVNGII